ncbi:MAG: RidA family protein [Proteobacteria bacterium]|nr:RidA family protein [Pseudomonadota bacterium]
MTIRRLHAGPRMSQAVIHAGLIFLTGQVGEAGDPVEAQTRTALDEIEGLLVEAGSSRDRILSATVWLADMADFAAMNMAWEAWFDGCETPARATGEARLAAPDYRVEIIVIAAAR